jgi:hypothetical protein
LLLIFGAIHGLIYLFVVPPWQHYDEPGHFEYVWLIANQPAFPQKGDNDENMLHELVRSMEEHGFYGGQPLPDQDWSAEELKHLIGISQVGDPPIYYWVGALPLRIVISIDITTQLYIVRGMSLLLYLVIIVAAWGVMDELLRAKHPLHWMVPAFIVALPGLVDSMTSVNNDVGAIAFFSLFIWISVRLIHRGVSVPGVLWLIVATGLCWWTKNTTLIVLPLAVVTLLLSFIRDRKRIIVWAALFLGCILLIATSLAWGDAAMWYRLIPQDNPTRIKRDEAPLGRYVFSLDYTLANRGAAIRQTIQPDVVLRLRGQRVTLGAWMWATSPVKAVTPILRTYEQNRAFFNEIIIGTEPEFHVISFIVPADTTAANILLSSRIQSSDVPIRIFYDGLILLEGRWPDNQLPVFADINGEYGTWGDQSFNNLNNNASAEEAQPWVRPWLDNLCKKWFLLTPSDVIASIVDERGSRWYFDVTLQNLLRTFWAKFGWGNVLLMGHKPYLFLGIISLIGILGAFGAYYSSPQNYR